MVRVHDVNTGELATIGVCPGCWHSKRRRATLFLRLAKMGLEVASERDGMEGTYLKTTKHAPACPYRG